MFLGWRHAPAPLQLLWQVKCCHNWWEQLPELITMWAGFFFNLSPASFEWGHKTSCQPNLSLSFGLQDFLDLKLSSLWLLLVDGKDFSPLLVQPSNFDSNHCILMTHRWHHLKPLKCLICRQNLLLLQRVVAQCLLLNPQTLSEPVVG